MIQFLSRTLLIAFLTFTIARCGETTEKVEITKSLKFTDAHSEKKTLIVDNINGSIKLTGYDGETVEVIAHETIDAESERKVETAKQKVKIDFTEDEDRVIIYVNTPWRYEDGSTHYHGSEYYGYDVQFDFEIKVPRKVNISLKTVNDGWIKVSDIEGDFTVNNVNGLIDMKNIKGSGKAHTVNGDVSVTFKENPSKETSFSTINGEVNIEFQENLSADLAFKTMNGEVYSDFDVKSMPVKPMKEKTHYGKHVYRSDDSFGVRVGSGGPEITFNTLNGDIYVTKNE